MLSPDFAFALEPVRDRTQTFDIAFIPNPYFENYRNRPDLDELLVKAWSNAVQSRSNDIHSVAIITFSTAKIGGDQEISKALVNKIENADVIVKRIEPRTYLEAQETIAQAKLVVSWRFHGQVLALIQRVPTIFISYEEKSRRLHRDLTLPKWGELTPEECLTEELSTLLEFAIREGENLKLSVSTLNDLKVATYLNLETALIDAKLRIPAE